MKPEAISEPVKGAAQGEFRLRVLLSDLRHYVRAAFCRYMVNHHDERIGLGWKESLGLFGTARIPRKVARCVRVSTTTSPLSTYARRMGALVRTIPSGRPSSVKTRTPLPSTRRTMPPLTSRSHFGEQSCKAIRRSPSST